MNKERLLDLANIIERDELPNVKFDMNQWARPAPYIHPECGTVACIAGYVVCAAHGNKKAKEMGFFVEDEAQRILDLTPRERLDLFHGTFNASRRKAARVLRHAATTGKIDWSI